MSVDAIRIDLPRTFPENIFFESIRTPLFNVLIAYANHNKEIGYCQGLNYIAGLILLVTKNEEWTFWLLKVLVEKIISSYHTKTMVGLITDIAVLRELLMERVPDVCEHLERCGLPCAVITTKWFICMFAEVLPIETVLRIWDCLFHEGSKVCTTTITITMHNRIHISTKLRCLFYLKKKKIELFNFNLVFVTDIISCVSNTIHQSQNGNFRM